MALSYTGIATMAFPCYSYVRSELWFFTQIHW